MSDMADVLARRNFEHEWGGDWEECPGDAKPGWIKDAQETLDFLSAAGFGPVREAAAAGIRSVYDIWGAGGRATVRMGEIHDADKTILGGEWDDHIKWNMADIAKERARAAAMRGEG